jgi:mRNA interferase HigB
MLIRGLMVIEKAMRKHPRARRPLDEWLEVATVAEWRNLMEVRASWPTADWIKGTDLTCFNIGGNSYRLLAIVAYSRQEIMVIEVLTHAEYNKRYT